MMEARDILILGDFLFLLSSAYGVSARDSTGTNLEQSVSDKQLKGGITKQYGQEERKKEKGKRDEKRKKESEVGGRRKEKETKKKNLGEWAGCPIGFSAGTIVNTRDFGQRFRDFMRRRDGQGESGGSLESSVSSSPQCISKYNLG